MTDSTNYFIAWWSAVHSRLSYLNPQQFLGRYTEIFGDKVGKITNGVGATSNDDSGGELPTTSVLDMMQKQANSNGIQGLLDDKVMLALQTANEKRWGLNVVPVDALNASVKPTTLTLDCITNYGPDGPVDAFGEASAVASWAEKVNIILGERRKMKEDTKNPASTIPDMLNCAPALVLKDNQMLVFRAISDSNYGTTYVFGDRRAPNLVWVVFRGTANAKSALAYSRPSSLTPTALANFFGIIDAGLIGIFKILQEQIHVIIQMAVDVANELNPTPGVPLAPGSIKLLTTGHSLGGAMATAFAGEYVQQISSDLTRIVGASIFDVNIGCYSLASPRVFGPKEAGIFCCLTQANDLCAKDPKASEYQAVALKVPGRISYLRVVTTLDLVTALPKVGYEHPCSEFDDGERDMITMDCDIEVGKSIVSNGNAFITNKASTRCLNLEHKRPAMTADFSKAPVCTDRRRKTWNISSMLYHLTYCGIMFAGGVDMSSALSLDVERLQSEDVSAAAVNPADLGIKADNTMMRILWYGFNQAAIAKCVFFDLAPFRVNETMVQGGGGFLADLKQKLLTKNKVVPEPAAATTPPAAAAAPAAPAAPAASPAPTPTQPDSSLLEDSKMTNTFIVGLKKDIADARYDYPILNEAFKPPILYKPLTMKGAVPPPPQYNFLYQLPANIGTSGRFTLFFGKAQPPRSYDASGNLMMNPDELAGMQQHVDFHNKLVSDHVNTAVAVINSKDTSNPTPLILPHLQPPNLLSNTQPAPAKLVLPPIPSPPNLLSLSNLNPQPAPAKLVLPPLPSRPIPNYDPANSSKLYFHVNIPHEGPEQFDCNMYEIKFSDGVNRFICTNSNVPDDSVPNTVYTKNGEKYDAIGNYRKSNDTYEFIPTPPAKGGRRTRRLHKLKSRKHKKGKKVARVSRRKHHKSHTKRH